MPTDERLRAKPVTEDPRQKTPACRRDKQLEHSGSISCKLLYVLAKSRSRRIGVQAAIAACVVDSKNAGCYSADRLFRGGVAQMVEHAAHIRSVKGSSPLAANQVFRSLT